MNETHGYIFKMANNEQEYRQVHQLNYETFVEEIPQHQRNNEKALVDRFHNENTYLICVKNNRVIGMLAVRDQRPFSLDNKLGQVEKMLPIRATHLCELRLLAVKKEYRKGRVFLGLSQLLSTYCLHKGYDAAVISGTTRQLKLYHQLGFKSFAHLIGTEEALYQPMYLTKATFQEILATKMLKRAASFLPGPMVVSDEILQAVNTLPVSHRSTDFIEKLNKVQAQLCALTNSTYVQVLLGSGTLANDAIAGQLLLLNGQGLIVVNGEFGNRLRKQAMRMGLSFDTLEKEWGQPFREKEIRSKIKSNMKWIWAVHSETSTGMLNDLSLFKELADEYQLKLCIDCISSLGSVPIDLAGVYLASGVSGKGLGALTGLSFVFHHHKIVSSNQLPAYIDLGAYMEQESIPYSHSSNLVDTLNRALMNHSSDYYQRVTLFYETVRSVIENIGVHIVTDREYSSPIILTIALPKAVSSAEIGQLLHFHGYLLHYESRYLQDRNWLQIACIGHNSDDEISKMLKTFVNVLTYELSCQQHKQ